MDIDELIVKVRRSRDARAAMYNEHGDELAGLRAKDTLTEAEAAHAEELKSKRAEIAAEVAAQDQRLAELESEKRADEAVARLQQESTPVQPFTGEREQRVVVADEPNPVYRRNDPEVSFFRDLFNGRNMGDQRALTRLAESQERAATTVSGAGGTFAPPAWLVEDFAGFARAARVTADLIGAADLPPGVSSVNVPTITAGAGVGVTVTQNTAIAESGITTSSVSSGISTISGKQTVSVQLLRQSGIPFDQVILGDLAAAYATMLDTQVLVGTGLAGQLRGLATSGTAVAYTTLVPAVVSATAADSFYSKGLGAISGLVSARFMPADAIVMHPRRWLWVLNALDGNSRPLVVPTGTPVNQVANGVAAAEGLAGDWLGLPVYVDPNIPTNLGAGTNQDEVFVLRTADLRLWESPLETASFEATLAAQNSVLFRVLGFAAFIPDRFAASVQVIGGTGLVAPTF